MQLSSAMGRKRSTANFPVLSLGRRLTSTSPHEGMGCPTSFALKRAQRRGESSSASTCQTS
eukprot:1803837-Alexandrium_andersonii.AAC.1